MKRPSISLDKEAVLNFLLMHGEKFVVALVALAALGLTWGGIDSVRSKTIRENEQPAVIETQVRAAANHIEREKKPPAEELRRGGALTEAVAAWKNVKVPAASGLAPLDKPLAEELRKRPKPQVFPVEQLQAVAGIAELAVKPATPEAPAEGMKITPFVIVTGLIPVQKQVDEYAARFGGVVFTDPKRDTPLWSDYSIERAVVGPKGPEKWTRVDVVAAVNALAGKGSDGSGTVLPAEFLLPPDRFLPEDKKLPPACGPLPPKGRGDWGPTGLHPWAVAELRRLAGERGAREKPAEKDSDKDDPKVPFVSENATDADPVAETRPEPQAGETTRGLPFRLLRFVDTTVEPGKSYAYKVRFELWNPNIGIEPRFLENAAVASDRKLVTPDAQTSAVTVPTPGAMLVRTLPKADMKLYRPGTFEVLVLAPGASGGYSLRSLVTDIGGLGNVDPRLNRVGEQRVRGEPIDTNFVLLDTRGRIEDRADVKGKRPPEPLELIWLRADGSFEYSSAADSQPLVTRYLDTLQAGGAKPATSKSKDEEPGKDEPKKPSLLNPRLFRGGTTDSKPDAR